jgi:hypothetical protein
MSGYLCGVVILLLLWAAAIRPLMEWLVGRLARKPAQGVIAWAFAMAPACAAVIGLTQLALPHSQLVAKWTQAQLQTLATWNYVGDGMVVVAVMVWAFLQAPAIATGTAKKP